MRALALVLLLMALPAWSADYIVPDDFPTIQAAVDASEEFDRIFVRPGTYNESIVVRNVVNLIIQGLDGMPTLAPGGRDGFFQRRPRDAPGSGLLVVGFNIVGARIAVRCDGCGLEDSIVSGAKRGFLSSNGGGVNRTTFDNVTGTCVQVAKGGGAGGCTFNGCGKDAVITSGGLRASYNTIVNSGGYGIRAKRPFGYEVNGNVVTGSGRAGISLQTNAPGTTRLLNDNVSDNNGTYGLEVLEKLSPSVVSAANSATGNGTANFRTKLGVE